MAAGRAPARTAGPLLDFLRRFYDLPERALEAVFQNPRRPAHERLAAIAAYLYRQPDDAGVRLFYPALEGIEEIAFAMRRARAGKGAAPRRARRTAPGARPARVAKAA